MPRSTYRQDRKRVYMHVVRNWAVYADEVAVAVRLNRKEADRLLRELAGKGLLFAEHVNGEKKLTWQSEFDVENEANVEERAEARFNEVYPAGKTQAPSRSHEGATGPTYTDEQLRRAKKLRASGLTWRAVAKEVGVKSPGNLSRRVEGRQRRRQRSAA